MVQAMIASHAAGPRDVEIRYRGEDCELVETALGTSIGRM
jgi:hypothetical protein